MSKLKFSKGKFSKFMSSKGFYVALAVCLVGASAATWLAVDRTITGIENQNNRVLQDEAPFAEFPLVEDVETKKPDVPMERQSESASRPSSSTSSSLPEESSKPASQSAPSTASAASPTLTYALPIRGDIINAYSDGELVKNITLGDWRTHDGMDIYADSGSDICAAADGVVAEVKNDALWGTIVVIDHADGNQTHYCGLHSNVPVKAGDAVSVRQSIGKLDGVPCEISDKSHLHFAIRRDGTWVNPMEVLSGQAQN